MLLKPFKTTCYAKSVVRIHGQAWLNHAFCAGDDVGELASGYDYVLGLVKHLSAVSNLRWEGARSMPLVIK